MKTKFLEKYTTKNHRGKGSNRGGQKGSLGFSFLRESMKIYLLVVSL
ncbi:hypothetical protein X559_0567 [Paenilisteria newyorkensis]|nr:hypothetical protein X559_0567 [Listeria newyorkensis]